MGGSVGVDPPGPGWIRDVDGRLADGDVRGLGYHPYMYPIVVLYLGLGVLMVFLGMPLWRALVPPNRWYGLRLPATLGKPSVWYAANARFGRLLTIVGAAIMTAAAVALIAGWTTVTTVITLGALVIAGVAAASVGGSIAARRSVRT